MGRVVRGAKCPWGEMSVGRIVRGAKCPWGEMSVGRNVRGANCPWGELSWGELSWGELSWGELSCGEWSGNLNKSLACKKVISSFDVVYNLQELRRPKCRHPRLLWGQVVNKVGCP
jgi:hypothetical protein